MDGTRTVKQVRRVLLITLALNTMVAAAKIVTGYLIRSVGMTADGFHSLFDGASNVVGLLGIWIASKPPDPEHPYGHKKYETLSTIAISLMMLLTAVEVLQRAVASLRSGAEPPEITTTAFVVMGITLIINIFVSLYEERKGREFGSDFLLADARHTRSDIYTSLSVIGGFIGVRLGLPILDPLVALFITALIGRMGMEILRSASDILVDSVVLDRERIRAIVIGVDGVRGCHRIRTRGRRDAVHVDLHVFVDPALRTDAAHAIVHKVIARIRSEIPEVIDAIVHVEPYRP